MGDRTSNLFNKDKPPYRIPLMSEVSMLPWNGLTVVSTFAGCGGSSTGYRMAGYRVLLANEFVPNAQENYRANMREGTVLDPRDVKLLTGADILTKTGLKQGELDVFDGSPPCQAFSTAGKREKGWGTEREYDHGAKQLNEDLFFEYCRLRDELMPRAFVAENVSGLVKGAAKGYFLEILKRLKVGYRVEARLLDAQWLGVPQARQRIIFVGIRDDLGLGPTFPRPLPYFYSVRDALPELTRVVHDTRGQPQYSGGDITGRPSVSILAHGSGSFYAEDRVVHATGRKGQPPRDITDQPSPTITAGPARAAEGGGPRTHFQVRRDGPSIDGLAIGDEYDKLNPGQQSDRFFSLVRAAPGAPSPTITAAGGNSASIAAVVHPTEKRKFTIAELKRICAFPDDYVLSGSYSQQWERLGNSVPPVMMFHVASALRDGVLLPARARTAGPAARSPGRSTTGKPRKGEGRSLPDAAPAAARTAKEVRKPRRPSEPRGREKPAGRAAVEG